MTDRPVIGQVGRTDAAEQRKLEFIGALKPHEWDEFVERLKEITKKYPNLTIKEETYNVKIKILEKLPKTP